MLRRLPLWFFVFAAALATLGAARPARADRLRDVCDVVGVRDNQLVGYGVVAAPGGGRARGR